ncbi:hypothetical protein KL935_005314 [Ogataea polymorpha]|uniref:Uncharacterized protein n=1 Tax=Ogataea polymorpha TaxID=460523 RepID=A0A1B7SD53_9ASCO|nr:uncharacterized protein OGAPODRAFT_17207 [Ogataea polymorpha]KAG7876612.1 hypothetical protein KL937_005348 [Ogataea polymorpha]KAG7885295.1 hypothetical protein KL936_005359 [Ogataea polymorpha]KAG7887743.1 hypothetical protein KL908_005394 [Ogataea polymorpha]KAG7897243.1 hypothetical protein KL935_005314 [Ogataea polymorpha]KAG7898187.1 hypothetical protein KL907_005383 [Ogataea polymorpha]
MIIGLKNSTLQLANPLLWSFKRFFSVDSALLQEPSRAEMRKLSPSKLKELKLQHKPKAPQSAYQMFIKHKFATNTDKNTNPRDLLGRFASEWKSASEEVKAPFVKSHKEAADEYAKEFQAWKEKYTVRSPYMNFFMSVYPKRVVKDFNQNSSIVKQIAEEWKALTPEQKESYRSKD